MYRMRLTAAAAAFLIAAGAGAVRAERFKYQFRTGQVIKSQSNLAGASLMGAGGTTMKMQFRVSIMQSQRVRSTGNGAATLDVIEVPISGHMTAFGRTEPY